MSLAGKPDIDTVTAARMVRPYAWVLDRVGDEGIRLTGAGYLPPAHVEAAATELGRAAWDTRNVLRRLGGLTGRSPALRGGVTEHRPSGFRPRCRGHLAGRRQATLRARHWARDTGHATLGTRHWAHDTGLSAYQGQPGPRASSGRTARSARRTSSSGSRKWSATLAKVAFPPAR